MTHQYPPALPRSGLRSAGLLLAGLLCIYNLSSAQVPSWQFSKVAAVGDPAPGGGAFGLLFAPGLNNRGEVALDGYPSPAFGAGEGVFLARGTNLFKIVRTGDLAPDENGKPTASRFGGFWLFGNIGLNNGGDIAFSFGVDPPTPVIDPQQQTVFSGVYRNLNGEGLKGVLVPNVTPAPGGGKFQGGGFYTSLNDGGDIAFAGTVCAGLVCPPPALNPDGSCCKSGGPYRQGVYFADRKGKITKVANPGDLAPRGTFDYAEEPWINNAGDIAFGGHIKEDPCINTNPTFIASCLTSVYIRDHEYGQIRSIAHQGDIAPGGGRYLVAFGPIVNDRGDIAFIGDTSSPHPTSLDYSLDDLGVYLNRNGATLSVARPGDPMPGGGNLARASFMPLNHHVNNSGDVVFLGTLNTCSGALPPCTGVPDQGLYLWSKGVKSLIARTGTAISGVGTVSQVSPQLFVDAGFTYPAGEVVINDRGQVAFQVLTTDGKNVVLLATPKGRDD